jgi:hypothetical protein
MCAPLARVAWPVNATEPKLSSWTWEPFMRKDSKIHSASCSQRAGAPENACVTLCPFELFVTTTVPLVFDVAVTVSETESPVLNEMPEKSDAPAGYHSYHATSGQA